TQIVEKKVKEADVVTGHDLVASEPAWLTIYQDGSVYRMPVGPSILENKLPAAFVHADARDSIVVVTERGQAGVIPAHQISGQGMPVAEVFGVPSDQRVMAALAYPKDVPDLPGYLFMATRQGVVKRVTLVDLVQAFGSFSLMNVADDDAIVAVRVTPGESEVILASAKGQAIRFSEEDVRPMGFNAGGVAGMKLIDNDQVVGMDMIQPRSDLLLLTQNGLGKRAPLAEFPKQGRAGQGVVAFKLGAADQVIGATVVQPSDQVAVVTSRGKSKLIKARSAQGAPRAAAGSSAYHLTKTEKVLVLIKPNERVSGQTAASAAAPKDKATEAKAMPAAQPKEIKPTPAKKISRRTK
ncbi:MAG TPA: DNA gyrase C-terminal beta-propeller domain-containing protein, partial [Anaerolineae bacterium]|nr:DNA gyrase C-terminal beta-propeller domain-containing protein [Anaerolineae bacterium]